MWRLIRRIELLARVSAPDLPLSDIRRNIRKGFESAWFNRWRHRLRHRAKYVSEFLALALTVSILDWFFERRIRSMVEAALDDA